MSVKYCYFRLSLLVFTKICCNFQDNEPLMRALSKLIYLNNPDLVLFVGEALVGNDAVDQLSKFNQVLFLYPWICYNLTYLRSIF